MPNLLCTRTYFKMKHVFSSYVRRKREHELKSQRAIHSTRRLAYLLYAVPRATEQAMARELKGESGAMQTWLDTSLSGLHALVGRIQV